MFQKPFRVKSNTSIKGSDRKKLRNELSKSFPGVSSDALTCIVPNKEEMSVLKVYTHSGQNCIIYCTLKVPVLFEIDTVVYPTVYTLWKHPDLLPGFTTWPPVFSKLTAGADLMLPGVIVHGQVTPSSLGDLRKGQMCVVNLAGNRAPIAVGKTALSSCEMYEASMRGKGIIILHTYQDHLWAHGDKSDPPLIKEICPEVLSQEGSCLAASEAECGPKDECVESASMQLTSDPELSSAVENLGSTVDGLSVEDEEDCQSAQVVVSPEEMDALLQRCFLCALKSDVKKSDLPVLTSKFFKYMQAWCPTDQHIDIKKSSYKKLSKFLQCMQSEGFITVKALTVGVDSIVDVDTQNRELRGFQLPEKPEVPLHDAESGDSQEFQAPVIEEMFSVTAALRPLIQGSGFSKGSALTKAEVHQLITEYVNANQLQDPANKGFVILDPHLHDCVASKGETIESLRWDNLKERVLSKMGGCYSIRIHGQPPIVKKGKIQPITLNVAVRSGNKKVTMVENVEAFGIEPQDLAHTVQVGVACSTSVTPLPGKGRGMQITIQGNQIDYIAKLLLNKYKVPRKYLEGLQKAPKGRKK